MVAALLSVLLFRYHAQSRSAMISRQQPRRRFDQYFDETIGLRID
jgi:hypothetical protein